MPQTLLHKKQAFAARAVDLAEQALTLVRELQEAVNNHADNQFAPGQAQEITQTDLDGNLTGHMTPQILSQLMTAFTSIYTLNAADRTALRKSVVKPTGTLRG